MSSKLPVLLLLTAVLMTSVAVSTIPASNALIQRDFSWLNDNHLTVLTGNTKVCGDHLCAPGEWDKLQTSINSAQLGNQTGKGASTTVTPTTVPPTTTPSVSPNVCMMVKSALTSENVSSAVAQVILSKLGC
ncbi:MAG: hypothetical protein KGH89_04920 [Thaumarchaeota archaeon]|nr:hypothetical protein [Nitrososphaerota archaeon]